MLGSKQRTGNRPQAKIYFAGLCSMLWAVTALAQAPLVNAVESVGFTVSDLERSVEFFARVLAFEKVSEVEVHGNAYEQLQGVFGLRMRVVRLRLGDEFIELTEYLAPRGRPLPADARSNDQAFQHIAIITSDLARAYQWLRQNKVEHASSGPQRLPDWNKNAGGIRPFISRPRRAHPGNFAIPRRQGRGEMAAAGTSRDRQVVPGH